MSVGRLQKKAEKVTRKSIDFLAKELGVKIPSYPKVYWINKNAEFEDFKINERDLDDFESVRKNRGNAYLFIPKIILIGDLDKAMVAEEAGHFLHYTNSKIKFSHRNNLDLMGLYAITEMFGFFCAKLADPNVKNPLKDAPDFFDEKEKCCKFIKENKVDHKKFFIYQQGYGLGEKLFEAYQSGKVSKESVRELFTNDFNENGMAMINFVGLRYNFEEWMNRNLFNEKNTNLSIKVL